MPIKKIEIPSTKPKVKLSYTSENEIINQYDKNMYCYLNYLNESFARDTTKICTSNAKSDFKFGVRAKKIVYNFNSEQMNLLYSNLNKNKLLARAV